MVLRMAQIYAVVDDSIWHHGGRAVNGMHAPIRADGGGKGDHSSLVQPGFTMSVEIHALAFADPLAARGADLFVSVSSGLHTVNSTGRSDVGRRSLRAAPDTLAGTHVRVCVRAGPLFQASHARHDGSQWTGPTGSRRAR
jgi:hypothetical protein